MPDLNTATAEGFKAAMTEMRFSKAKVAMFLRVPEDTIREWTKGRRPVNPVAATMMKWLLTGWRPADVFMSGGEVRDLREHLGMKPDCLAAIFGVSPDLVTIWEEDPDEGPPVFVAEAMRWLVSDHPPPTGALQEGHL